VSLPAVLARIAELQGVVAPPPAAPAATATQPGAFAGTLQAAQAPLATATVGTIGGTSAGQAMVRLAAQELGVTEQPPGSNDSPRIAQFRQATAGAPGPGPWCAYFTSWAAREVGAPLGERGQGFGRVDDVWAWAERTGRSIPAGSGTPQVGDLVVWDEHVGIVESVKPDGGITTIEGNSSNRVARRDYGPGANGAIGYVRVG
jgi:hypothetical protein